MRYHYVITLRSIDGKYGTHTGFIDPPLLTQRSTQYAAILQDATSTLRFRNPSVIFFVLEPQDLP
ncbi:hypothetical protein ACWGH5_17415 [Streptomyces sp. NPDC054864]